MIGRLETLTPEQEAWIGSIVSHLVDVDPIVREQASIRIKELGRQFGIKGLCCQSFWATEAAYHLAITGYNLCVLLQRRLGQLAKCELITLRWRLFTRAAVFSRAQGKATLKLAVHGRQTRRGGSTSSKNSPPRPTAMQLNRSAHDRLSSHKIMLN